MVSLLDTTCGLLMAQTAEKLARRFEISRQAQDEFALLSQQRAGKAQAAGCFRDEIVPVTVALATMVVNAALVATSMS